MESQFLTQNLFALFFVIWAVIAIATAVFFRTASLEQRRAWHPRIIVGSGLFFLLFVTAIDPRGLVLAVPAVALISYLSIKLTKFCSACGAMNLQNPPWQKMTSCPRCGASLEKR